MGFIRLLNVRTWKFKEFGKNTTVPNYVIASHRWDAEETSFDDVENEKNQHTSGYKKVEAFAKYVREAFTDIVWLWIDTCCINKTIPTELSYAITSMFDWYRNTELCIAYLRDIPKANSNEALMRSVWFTRAWTLQELLAPKTVLFVTENWEVIGNKGALFHGFTKIPTGIDLASIIASQTGLPESVLHDWAKAVNISVETKLRWMDARSSTVAEDHSYALAGIVGINLVNQYGEGRDRARQRLESAIQHKNQLDEQKEQKFRDIVARLGPCNPWTNHDKAQEMHEQGTGAWFLTSREYRDWKFGDSRCLWLYGKVGCGKTVLCSSIVKDIYDYCMDRSDAIQAIFYFSFSETRKQSLSDLLVSIVAQLGEKAAGRDIILGRLGRIGMRSPNNSEIEETLRDCIRAYREVFIHIDALDECPEPTGQRGKALDAIQRLLCEGTGQRVIFTSRDELDIRHVMQTLKANKVPLEVRVVQPEIERYVEGQIARSLKLSCLSAELQSYIRNTLSTKADGMFRWVYCQLLELDRSKSTRPSEIKLVLERLPITLDETYERMLTAIHPDDRSTVRDLLRWLAFAERPLTLLELSETRIIHIGGRSLYEDKLYTHDRGHFSDVLRLLPGLIVTVVNESGESESEDSDQEIYRGGSSAESIYRSLDFEARARPDSYVRFAHFSVAEFLQSKRVLNSRAKYFHQIQAREHNFIAQKCLAYLTHYIGSVDEVNFSLDAGYFPLLKYVSRSWWFHAGRQGSSNNEREMKFLTNERQFQRSLQVFDPDAPYSMGLNIPRASALYYCAHAGLEHITRKLLEAGTPVDAPGGLHGSALQVASYGGHEVVVKTLLRAGADINAQVGHYGSTIQAASHKGHESVVRLLLEGGVDVNACGGEYGHTLLAASYNGHEGVVEVLLGAGANVNWQGGSYGSALQVASYRGYKAVVRILLDAKAPTNGPKEDLGAAIYLASFAGHMPVIQLLLDAKANVNAQVGMHGSALQAASWNGHEDIVRILLKAGADVNAQGGEYGSALRAASENGHWDIVRILRKAGADVSTSGGAPTAQYRPHD